MELVQHHNKLEACAIVAWLMARSKHHRSIYRMGDYELYVINPVMMDQYILAMKDYEPIGFATWAWVNDELAEEYRNGPRPFEKKDWQSGNNLFVVDLMCERELLPFCRGLRRMFFDRYNAQSINWIRGARDRKFSWVMDNEVGVNDVG